jgi:HEAT repeat protein
MVPMSLVAQPSQPDLDTLRRQLRSRNRGEGYRAADQLAELGPEGRTLLLKALDSRDRNVRLHAAWATRKLHSANAVIKLVGLLREDPEFYLPLQQCLSGCSESECLQPLVEAAKDLRNPQRKFHTMLLGELSAPEVIDTLLIAIQSDDQLRQEGAFLGLKHACLSLREAAAPGLVQALSVRLPLPSSWRWTWTARQRAEQIAPLSLTAAVGLVAGEPAVGVLCEILRSSAHPQYRLAAISALITVGEAAVGRSAHGLLQLLQNRQDSELAQAAAEALRRLRAELVEQPLLELLESPLAFQRRHAVDALEGCGRSFEALFARVADPDVHVRRSAVRALAGDCDELLLQALGDRDRWVGWNAAWKLGQRWRGQTPPHWLVDRVLRLLESPLARTRKLAAESLGQMAASSPEVVEALVAVLGGLQRDVCRSAAWALRQVDLAEALGYASMLRTSPDHRQRGLGQRAARWLTPRYSSYTPHLPVRSSALSGVFNEV